MWGNDATGAASDKPSAWSCATLPSSVPPAEILPALAWFKAPLVMATFADRTLPGESWIAISLVRGGTSSRPHRDGLPPARRKVSYQNGGWYNLGGAHYLGWNDPYWMAGRLSSPRAIITTYPPRRLRPSAGEA